MPTVRTRHNDKEIRLQQRGSFTEAELGVSTDREPSGHGCNSSRATNSPFGCTSNQQPAWSHRLSRKNVRWAGRVRGSLTVGVWRPTP